RDDGERDRGDRPWPAGPQPRAAAGAGQEGLGAAAGRDEPAGPHGRGLGGRSDVLVRRQGLGRLRDQRRGEPAQGRRRHRAGSAADRGVHAWLRGHAAHPGDHRARARARPAARGGARAPRQPWRTGERERGRRGRRRCGHRPGLRCGAAGAAGGGPQRHAGARRRDRPRRWRGPGRRLRRGRTGGRGGADRGVSPPPRAGPPRRWPDARSPRCRVGRRLGGWYPARRHPGRAVAEYIYSMVRARKAHGDKVILDDVTMSFLPGAKIGMVGPNGAGKSTILKIMAGLEQPSNGEARLSPGYSVGILLQEPPLDESKTVLGNVQDGLGDIKRKLDRFNEIGELMADPEADYDALLEEMGKLQADIDAADAWDLDSQLEQAMDALRCPPGDEPVTNLSGGERRRVALCKLLLQKPDLLLLDEPTNHLDDESVQCLEPHLATYPGAVIAVTHDRYFLDDGAGWIAEVDRGRLYPYEDNYSTYLEKKQESLQIQGRKDAKLAKRLASELE